MGASYTAARWRSSATRSACAVRLEAGEWVLDKADAAGWSGVPGQEQGLGGGRGGLGFLQVQVARGSVGEEHASDLAPKSAQRSFR
jgi:hypothetical protein